MGLGLGFGFGLASLKTGLSELLTTLVLTVACPRLGLGLGIVRVRLGSGLGLGLPIGGSSLPKMCPRTSASSQPCESAWVRVRVRVSPNPGFGLGLGLALTLTLTLTLTLALTRCEAWLDSLDGAEARLEY